MKHDKNNTEKKKQLNENRLKNDRFSEYKIFLKERNFKTSPEPVTHRYLGQVCHLSTTFIQ